MKRVNNKKLFKKLKKAKKIYFHRKINYIIIIFKKERKKYRVLMFSRLLVLIFLI